MSEIFAKRLKAERESKGWTQEYMAQLLGISNGTLSGYERNYREPDLDTLTKIAMLLDISIDYLLGKSDIREPYKYETKDLEKLLKESNVQFDGAPLTEEEKESVLGFIKLAIETIRKKRR